MANIIQEYRGLDMALDKMKNLLSDANTTKISDMTGSSETNELSNVISGKKLSEKVSNKMSKNEDESQNYSNASDNEDTQIKLVKPYNPTDPIVVFDPTYEKTEIAKIFYGSEENEPADFEGDVPDANNLKIDGVKIPIIQLNNTAIDFENIDEMSLKLKGFLPELELKIYDYSGMIKATDAPGINNLITVILISENEGTNKKISLDFYITECIFNVDNTINYKGIMNLTTFRSKQNKQIGNGKLTTYEMLEQIAKENHLGFAATENCKSVNDKRYRQIYGETFTEYIEEQMSFAGTGRDTIIDAWVDEFGYLVMVNFSWVMSYKINPFQLTIKTISGINGGSKQSSQLDTSVTETVRMITNATASKGIMDNMKFSTYTHEIDNNKAIENGTASKYYYLNDPGGQNLIQECEGVVIEPSLDGAYDIGQYANTNIEFIGFNFTDDDDTENVPIIVQKKNISNYKASMCNKSIIVEMTKPNYLLQRGTLVAVDIEETDDLTKRTLIDDSNNVFKGKPDDNLFENDIESPEADNARRQLIFNNMESMQNVSVSGIYYIKDIEFKYNVGEAEIKQIMTLVKKGLKSNINNYATATKYKFGKLDEQQSKI